MSVAGARRAAEEAWPGAFVPQQSFSKHEGYSFGTSEDDSEESYAKGDSKERSLEAAEAACTKYADVCTGVACESDGDKSCTVQAGQYLVEDDGSTAYKAEGLVWPDGSKGMVAPGVGTGPWATKDGKWFNWNELFSCEPAKIHYPSSEDDLRDILRSASSKGRKLKVWGGGLSLSAVANCDDGESEMVSLNDMNKTVKISNTSKDDLSITVQAGMRLKELYPLMEESNLAFKHVGTVIAQSVAGFISTGTHGTHVDQGTVAGLVIGMRLMLANGTVLEVDESDKEMLNAMQCSVGALGVITEVTMKCIPTFRARRVKTPIEWSEDIVEGVRDFLEWKPERRIKQWYLDFGTPGHRRRGGLRKASTVTCEDEEDEHPDCKPWWETFLMIHNDLLYSYKVNEKEMAMDRNVSHKVIKAFKEFVHEHRHRLDPDRVQWHILGRYVAKDDAWLSPSSGRDSAFMTFYMFCVDASVKRKKYCQGSLNASVSCNVGETVACDSPFLKEQIEFFGMAWEQIAYSVGQARPHWGKTNNANASYLATVYPKHKEFVRLARKLDPKGMFMNDYLRQRLGSDSD